MYKNNTIWPQLKKKEGILPFMIAWIKLEAMKLSEVREILRL